jgi:short-subunit dehydrogenase
MSAISRLKQPLTEIRAARGTGNTEIKHVYMDLVDFQTVRRAAKELKNIGKKIDVVVNNAGIMAVPYKKVNGYESHFVA